MSETRRAFLAISFKSRSGGRHTDRQTRLELFAGELFSVRTAVDIVGNRIPRESITDYVRLRVNGRWFPAKTVTLYTREQVNSIIGRFADP